MKWRVVLEPDPETGAWAVWCPELPGCVSKGETEEEALENIRGVFVALERKVRLRLERLFSNSFRNFCLVFNCPQSLKCGLLCLAYTCNTRNVHAFVGSFTS